MQAHSQRCGPSLRSISRTSSSIELHHRRATTKQHEDFLLWLLVAFIAFFAFSQGAVIWVDLSEVFPNVPRARGQSFRSFTHRIMTFAISLIFPVLAAHSGAIPFGFFAAMMAVQTFVVRRFYPETSGITLEEMQKRVGA